MSGYHDTGYYATGYYRAPFYARTPVVLDLPTYRDLIDEVRFFVGDENEFSYRYEDEALVCTLNRALHELARLRPDAYRSTFSLGDLGVPEVTSEVPASGQINWEAPFGLDLQFWQPIMYYVCGMTEMIEDEYAESGRAIAQYEMFRTSVLHTGVVVSAQTAQQEMQRGQV